MAGGGNAAGSRFEPADAAEVRGDANGSTAIAAHTSGGASGSDGSSFSATRSARRAREIPGIVGASIEKVIGLPCHQQLGSVRNSKNDCARLAQTCDQGSIRRRHTACAQFCSGLTAKSTAYID